MEVERRYGNILIMAPDLYMDNSLIDYSSDFYVGSFCNKKETCILLQKAITVLENITASLPISPHEKILVTVSSYSNSLYEFYFESPISKESTLHILSRITKLLDDPNSCINFFHPKN